MQSNNQKPFFSFLGKKTKSIKNIQVGDIGVYHDVLTYFNQNDTGDAVKHNVFTKVIVIEVYQDLVEVEVLHTEISESVNACVAELAKTNLSRYISPKKVKWQIKAEIDKEVEFRIQSCPNLDNGGELEDMAIIDTGEAKSISEIMEKFKGKTMFPQALKRAEESLRGVVLPHVKNNSKMYHENELGKILLDFMLFDRQEGDTRGSVIERFLSELKNKNNEK